MPKTLLLADDSVTIQKVVGISLANEDIKLVYSTPTQFYAELRKDNAYIAENGGWPVRKDDLFPMEDPESKSYLSGYYSARPLLK